MRRLALWAQSNKITSNIRQFRLPLKVFLGISGLIWLSLLSLAGCAAESVASLTPEKPPQTSTTSTTLETPKSTLYLDKAAFIENGLRFQVRASVFNPNSINISVDTLKINLKNEAGKIYAQKDIPGSQVSTTSSKSFSLEIDAPVELYSEDIFLISLSSEAKSGKGNLPFSSSMRIVLTELKIETLAPKLTLSPNALKLTTNGYNLVLETQVNGILDNPNPLRLDFSTIRILFKDRTGNIISNSNIEGSSVLPGSAYSFSSDWNLPLRIMNEKGFMFAAESWAGIGRFSRAINSSLALAAPELKKLILIPEMSLKTDPVWKTESTRTTLSINVIATIKNANWFILSPGVSHAYIYDSKGAQLSSVALSGADIPGAKEGDISGVLQVGTDKIGPAGGQFTIKVENEIGITGVNEKIPLTVSTVIPLKPPSDY